MDLGRTVLFILVVVRGGLSFGVPTKSFRGSSLLQNRIARSRVAVAKDNSDSFFDTTGTAIASSSIASSVITMWSEYSIAVTTCGPTNLNDQVERASYLMVLVVAGCSIFLRIVTGKGLACNLQVLSPNGKKEEEGMASNLMVMIAELFAVLAVIGAFLALGEQTLRGERMDGLSGIDVDMCRAMATLDKR